MPRERDDDIDMGDVVDGDDSEEEDDDLPMNDGGDDEDDYEDSEDESATENKDSERDARPSGDRALDIVVAQDYQNSCASASGEMILKAQGFKNADGAQDRLVERLGGDGRTVINDQVIDIVDFNKLPEALAEETKGDQSDQSGQFFGGQLDIPEDKRSDTIDFLNSTGSWAAEVRGGNPHHIIVVDGGDDQGNLRIRDPMEERPSTMSRDEFLECWTDGAVFWKRFEQNR